MEIVQFTDRKKFDEAVKSLPFVHYMKMSGWGAWKEENEHLHPRYLGLYENDVLCATAMMLRGRWMGHSYLYIPWGPNMDYENRDLVVKVFSALKDYAEKERVVFLRVDPNVERMHKDLKGAPIEDGFNNEWVTNCLKELGYTHKGYGYAYNGSWTNRFTLIVDISKPIEEVYRSFENQRRTSLRRHKVNHVSTRTADEKDIPALMAFEKQLAEQEGFKPHSHEFFASILREFPDNAAMYLTSVDLAKMIEGIDQELASKKYTKDLLARAKKEEYRQMAVELKDQYGDVVDVACGLFIRIGKRCWDLYIYNNKPFGFLRPTDSLHAFAMADMKEHGVEEYDLCGFSGETDPSDPNYGLYRYKSTFAPRYVEHIGEFDYVFQPERMKRFRFEKLAVNHVKRRWWTFRYQKKQK